MHIEVSNWRRITDNFVAKMRTIGFNSVTVGFSQRSYTENSWLGFQSVCKGGINARGYCHAWDLTT